MSAEGAGWSMLTKAIVGSDGDMAKMGYRQ